MLRRPSALLALLLLGAAGCAGQAGHRDVGSWLEARGADLLDVASARLAFGAGLGVYARATHLAQLGFLLRGSEDERHIVVPNLQAEGERGVRALPCVVVGNWGRYGGLWFDSCREVMLPAYGLRDIRREAVVGVVPPDGLEDPWRWAFGAGVHAFVVGAEVEVRPHELVDFLAAFVGLDPAADDVPGLEPDQESDSDEISSSAR